MTMGTWTFFKMYIYFLLKKVVFPLPLAVCQNESTWDCPRFSRFFGCFPTGRGLFQQTWNPLTATRNLKASRKPTNLRTWRDRNRMIKRYLPLQADGHRIFFPKSGWFLGETKGGGVLIKNRIQGFINFSLKKQWCWFGKIHQNRWGWSKCSERTKS